MKSHLIFSALGLVLLFSACQKDKPLSPADSSDTFAPPPSERCGCTAPAESKIEKVTDVSAGISWSNVPEAGGYRIDLKKGEFSEAADGFTDTYIFEMSNNDHLALTNLAPDTRYYYRLTSICGYLGSNQSLSCNSTLNYFDTKASPVHGDPPVYDRPSPGKYGPPPAQ